MIRKTVDLKGYTGKSALGEALASPSTHTVITPMAPTPSPVTPTMSTIPTTTLNYIDQLPPGDPEADVAQKELEEDQEAEEESQAVNLDVEDILTVSTD